MYWNRMIPLRNATNLSSKTILDYNLICILEDLRPKPKIILMRHDFKSREIWIKSYIFLMFWNVKRKNSKGILVFTIELFLVFLLEASFENLFYATNILALSQKHQVRKILN